MSLVKALFKTLNLKNFVDALKRPKGITMQEAYPTSSQSTKGKSNFMTAAWNCYVGPRHFAVMVGQLRYTWLVINDTKEFNVCFPPPEISEISQNVGTNSGAFLNKVKKFGLEKYLEKGEKVKCPYLNCCYAVYECKLAHLITAGDHDIVIGEIVNVINNDKIDRLVSLYCGSSLIGTLGTNMLKESFRMYYKTTDNSKGVSISTLGENKFVSPKEGMPKNVVVVGSVGSCSSSSSSSSGEMKNENENENERQVNFAACVWHSYVTYIPPVYIICMANSSFTSKAIKESRIFNVQFVPFEAAEVVHELAQRSGHSGAKKLTKTKPGSKLEQIPVLASAYACYECRVRDMVQVGGGGNNGFTVFVGDIVGLVVEKEAFDGNLLKRRNLFFTPLPALPGDGKEEDDDKVMYMPIDHEKSDYYSILKKKRK